jgi:ABC-type bacteriocin/lantibiotic exporter with double-glycine peptidase domain
MLGKSTLLQLIERMYDPQEGRIIVDGYDLKQLDPRYVRRHISIVAQEPVLFGNLYMHFILCLKQIFLNMYHM